MLWEFSWKADFSLHYTNSLQAQNSTEWKVYLGVLPILDFQATSVKNGAFTQGCLNVVAGLGISTDFSIT